MLRICRPGLELSRKCYFVSGLLVCHCLQFGLIICAGRRRTHSCQHPLMLPALICKRGLMQLQLARSWRHLKRSCWRYLLQVVASGMPSSSGLRCATYLTLPLRPLMSEIVARKRTRCQPPAWLLRLVCLQLTTHKDLKVQSWAAHPASPLPEIPLCESWQQSVQYIDERPVVQVSQNCLAVHASNSMPI